MTASMTTVLNVPGQTIRYRVDWKSGDGLRGGSFECFCISRVSIGPATIRWTLRAFGVPESQRLEPKAVDWVERQLELPQSSHEIRNRLEEEVREWAKPHSVVGLQLLQYEE